MKKLKNFLKKLSKKENKIGQVVDWALRAWKFALLFLDSMNQ